MKKCLLLIVVVSLNLNLKAQQIISDFIYFSSDQYEITASSKTKLDGLIQSISKLENPQIQLTGHTDDQGDEEYNLTLSKNRVHAVSDYFKNKGLEKANIKLDFYGETIPVTKNETEVDRQSNRRVEVKIIELEEQQFTIQNLKKESSPLISESVIEIPEIEYANPLEVLADFGYEAQRFFIQNDRDTVLQGVDGTILFFKAGSFNSKEVTCDYIEIQLKEFYTPEQIILNNLNTQAGSRLLETQGAIKVEAYCNNKLLNLKRGKKLDLYFPNLNDNNDYQLFSGKEDENGVNWVKDSRNLQSDFNPELGRNNYTDDYRISYCNYNFFLKRWFCQRKSKKNWIRRWRNLSSWAMDLGEQYGKVNFVNVYKDVDKKTLSVFTTSRMGYINCDRFLNNPKRQLANVYIKEAAQSKKQVMMTSIVFKDIKSVMSGSLDDQGRHWYLKIPKQVNVWVVAVKKEKDEYYLAIEDHVLNGEPIEDLTFEQVSEKQLKTSLAEIGW